MKFATLGLIAAAAAYEKSDKVKVELFYESQCPACKA